MKKILDEIRNIKNYKLICGIYFGIAVLCYGYLLSHSTIGMDDTGIGIYFTEGLAPQVGRWTIFLFNKIFHVSIYTPYYMDAIGVLLMIASMAVYVIYFSRLSGNRIHTLSYISFGAIFISSPFMGEVFIYYLHNGIGLSFLLMALTGLFLLKVSKERKYFYLIPSSLFLSLAIGCYESFALVYLMQICTSYAIEIVFSEKKTKKSFKQNWKMNLLNCLKMMGIYMIPLLISVFLRKMVSLLITSILGVPMQERDASRMQYWFMNDFYVIFKDLVKQFLLRYFVNGKYIYGVFVFSLMMVGMGIVFFIIALWKKRLSIIICGILMAIIPWLLVPVELVITPYRACQTVILFNAFIAMLIVECLMIVGTKLRNGGRQTLFVMGLVFLFVLVFNQGFELNQYFYFDDLKGRNDKEVCTRIAYELMENNDITKPVAFVGKYVMPKSLRKYVWLAPDSKEFISLNKSFKVSAMKSLYTYGYMDDNYGYKLYEIGSQDPLTWMTWASLRGTLKENAEEKEIYHYLNMLGFDFIPATQMQIEKADKMTKGGPVWPEKGSVAETDEMIIVRIGE